MVNKPNLDELLGSQIGITLAESGPSKKKSFCDFFKKLCRKQSHPQVNVGVVNINVIVIDNKVVEVENLFLDFDGDIVNHRK